MVASYGQLLSTPRGAQRRKTVTALANGLEIPFADVSPESPCSFHLYLKKINVQAAVLPCVAKAQQKTVLVL